MRMTLLWPKAVSSISKRCVFRFISRILRRRVNEVRDALQLLGPVNHEFRHAIWVVDAKVVEREDPVPQDESVKPKVLTRHKTTKWPASLIRGTSFISVRGWRLWRYEKNKQVALLGVLGCLILTSCSRLRAK